MHAQGGFLDTPRRSPVGIGFVIALHGAALAALILAPPEFVGQKFKRFVVQEIPLAPPPPENPPPPQPQRPVARKVVTSDPVVKHPAIDDTRIATVDPATLPELPRDPARIVQPDPRPDPVLASAAPDPRYADLFQPPYPPSLARQEIEGRAVVRVLIGADGRVKAVEGISADDPAFLEATRKQALRWRFRPATRDGVPVESWRTMTVRFQMRA